MFFQNILYVENYKIERIYLDNLTYFGAYMTNSIDYITICYYTKIKVRQF